MTYSKLATRVAPTHKKSSRQGNKPERFIIHHTAGGSDEFSIYFLSQSDSKKVSAHYIVLRTGEAVSSVEEEMRAWTTGWNADKTAITCETVNTTGAPDWKVSDAQLETLAQLAADFSIRYNWGPLNRTNVMGHREFAATACPGPYIWPRMDAIVKRANQIRAEKLNVKPPPPPEFTGDLAAIDALIKRVIRGELGNGQTRIDNYKRLGFNDEQIVALNREVTRRYNEIKAGADKPTVTYKDLLAVDAVIKAIIRGEFGNGDERVAKLKSLGWTDAEIKAIQAAVTQRMRG